MPQGIDWTTVTENSVEWRSPNGDKHPVALISKDDSNAITGPMGVKLRNPVTLIRSHNGAWYVWSTDSSVLDLDGEPFPANTRIDETRKTVTIPEPPANNVAPVISYEGTALPDVTAAGVWDGSITLTITDPPNT